MPSRILAASGALLLAVLLPASAHAVTIAPLKPCYVTAGTASAPQQEGVQITASGFTANSKVDLSIDDLPVPNGTGLQADMAGALVLPPDAVAAPFMAEGSREFTITLREQGVPANTVSATARTTALDVSPEPERAAPSDVIRFRGSGFTADRPVFAHYVYRRKQRKRVRMVRRPGLCGTWSVRRRQIPVRKAKTGLWTVQFDQTRRYVDGTLGVLDSVYVRLGINVTLVTDG